MLTRRDFLKASLAGALSPVVLARRVGAEAPGAWVNDVHSRLNRTRVAAFAPIRRAR